MKKIFMVLALLSGFLFTVAYANTDKKDLKLETTSINREYAVDVCKILTTATNCNFLGIYNTETNYIKIYNSQDKRVAEGYVSRNTNTQGRKGKYSHYLNDYYFNLK